MTDLHLQILRTLAESTRTFDGLAGVLTRRMTATAPDRTTLEHELGGLVRLAQVKCDTDKRGMDLYSLTATGSIALRASLNGNGGRPPKRKGKR